MEETSLSGTDLVPLFVSSANGKLPRMTGNDSETSVAEKTAKTGLLAQKRGTPLDRRVSVAPMMDWTDRHCRYFLRGFSPRTLLYTEMITAAAILRGDRARLLEFDPEEHPVALQLGGNDPQELAAAAAAGEEAGYDEINLNCGCPSDRVASGSFGACLMLEPARVADCVAAMSARVSVPVTVKMRVGVVNSHARESRASIREAVSRFDEADYESLHDFVDKVRAAGCQVAMIHARKAVLGGLSPKDNREIPPLRFDVVKRIKQAFPHLPVVVNGGIREAGAALEALGWCQGVMLGREAYHRPFVLTELQRALYPNEPTGAFASRQEMLERMARYAQKELARGARLSSIARHMLGLYGGQPGAREYRRFLSEGARAEAAGPDLLRRAARLAEGRPSVIHEG
jgi:tRNA-dihydrouridine synthase A